MFAGRIYMALLALALSYAGLAQTDTNTRTTLRFKAQLSLKNIYAWDAGEAHFSVQGGQMRFEIYLHAQFNNFCSVALYTDSRQVVVQPGAGTFMYHPMCEPVLVPGSNPPVYVICDVLTAVYYYAGAIPLNETLLRELIAGQGEIHFFQPASDAGSYWNTPPAITGRLLVVPGGDATNALANLPRPPRSLTAVVGAGPLYFPFEHNSATTVDVDFDGVADFGLHAQTLCTMSIPADCVSMFGLSCASNRQVLVQGLDALVVPMGTTIGAVAPTNATWGTPGGDSLTSTLSGSRYVPWTGELGRLGEAYIGFRLRREDGDHYGWMRIRLPRRQPILTPPPYLPDPSGPGGMPHLPASGLAPTYDSNMEPILFEFGPVIEDWAYEPTPNTPIQAGARPFSAALSTAGMKRPGFIRASFSSNLARAYAVQFKPDLSTRGWTNLGWLIIPTAPETLLDLPVTGTQGFYRVLEAE